MIWIVIIAGAWVALVCFFLMIWSFAFRAGVERGRIEGGIIGYQHGRREERRDQTHDPLP